MEEHEVLQQPDVDVIIVTYKGKAIISECIQAVLEQDYPQYRCLVIDNDSPDRIGDDVKEKFPGVHVHRCTENLGWSGGLNAGITLGASKYVLALNDDVVLTSKNWISELVRTLENDRRIGAAIGKIVFYDQQDIIQTAGNTISRSGNGVCLGVWKHIDDPRYNRERNVLYACDAAALFRRDVLQELGLMEDLLRAYVDVDFGWRLNLAGYKFRYLPGITAAHRSSYTVGNTSSLPRVFRWTVGRAVIIIKHYELKNLLKYLPWTIIKSLLECVKVPRRGGQILRAWGWVLWHLREIFQKRRKIQALRRVSDAELMPLFAHNLEKRQEL